MPRICYLLVAALIPSSPAIASDPKPLRATVESTLPTGAGRIRQFAFDGDEATYFASERAPSAEDHFTLVLDRPIVAQSIAILTGKPDGSNTLESGTLELSDDGETFRERSKIDRAVLTMRLQGARIRAIRIRPGAKLECPLVVREIVLASEPAVPVCAFPVEFTVDVAEAPEMKSWAERAARVCERNYAMINEELRSDGYQPPRHIRMSLKKSYRGVAMTSDDRITGSVRYFERHPDDLGAMVHETVHVVQRYRGPGSDRNPDWLVEGVADYVRFFKYEPGHLGRIDPEKAHYNSSYRVSAAFLAYLTEKYDRQLVLKLNRAMREGKYSDEIFKELTGKRVTDLDAEWRATLKH